MQRWPAAGVEVGGLSKRWVLLTRLPGLGQQVYDQFVKELVGVGADDPCVQATFDVNALFIEGQVARFLR